MSYKNLTSKKIYQGEANYALDDFMRDFRKKAEKDWGSELLDKSNKNQTLYQGILIIVVFASQRKSLKTISKLILGKSAKKHQGMIKKIVDMYSLEIEILEGLQMKMFLDNLKLYGLSDSLNLQLLDADFRVWFKKALNYKN